MNTRRFWLMFLGGVILLFFLPVICAKAYPAYCISPELLKRTTARIFGMITVEDKNGPQTIPYGGTGVFISPTHIITVEHVAEVIARRHEWLPIVIEQQQTHWMGENFHREVMPVRIVAQFNAGARDQLYILELQRVFGGNTTALLRDTPPTPGEVVSGVGYPLGVLKTATGVFLRRQAPPDCASHPYDYTIEMVGDDGNRLVLDSGSSGGGIFDCSGRLILLSSHVWAQSGRGDYQVAETCTGKARPKNWGTMTNLATPVAGLRTFLEEFLTVD